MKKNSVKKTKSDRKQFVSVKKLKRSAIKTVKQTLSTRSSKKLPKPVKKKQVRRAPEVGPRTTAKVQQPETEILLVQEVESLVQEVIPSQAPPLESGPKAAAEVFLLEEQKSSILLLGENALIGEYTRTCCTKGFEVYILGSEEEYSDLSEYKTLIHYLDHIPEHSVVALELTNTNLELKKQNLWKLDVSLPPSATILSSSITVTATEQSSWIMHKHRLVGIGALPTLSNRPAIEVAPTVFNPDEIIEIVRKFFHHLDKEIILVQDRIGMVFPRMICQVINEAAHAIQEGVADPKDLDIVMKEACQFPAGPIEWADRIGLDQVVAVLAAVQQAEGGGRTRISPLLPLLAHTGKWWKQDH
ncbi:MAG: 3-hydroxyacyl-CoA dehydrogenase family protein [bacterium]